MIKLKDPGSPCLAVRPCICTSSDLSTDKNVWITWRPPYPILKIDLSVTLKSVPRPNELVMRVILPFMQVLFILSSLY